MKKTCAVSIYHKYLLVVWHENLLKIMPNFAKKITWKSIFAGLFSKESVLNRIYLVENGPYQSTFMINTCRNCLNILISDISYFVFQTATFEI